MYLKTSAATPMSTGVFKKVGGVTASGDVYGPFLIGSGNRIIYLGQHTITVQIQVSLSYKTSGAVNNTTFVIYKNGDAIQKSKNIRYSSNAKDYGVVSLQTLLDFVSDDYVELWAAVDGNVSLTMDYMNFLVHSI